MTKYYNIEKMTLHFYGMGLMRWVSNDNRDATQQNYTVNQSRIHR